MPRLSKDAIKEKLKSEKSEYAALEKEADEMEDSIAKTQKALEKKRKVMSKLAEQIEKHEAAVG